MELDAAGIERMRRILRHRLLNIVSGVKSANSMLANQLDDRLEPREREYFPLIQNECDQVSVIVNRMDELLGPVPPPSPAPLQTALDAVATDLRERFPMAEIELSVEVADSARPVCAKALQIVLAEAVGNAFEISRKPMSLKVSDQGDSCCLQVVDQGEPVSDEALVMAFEPFYTGRTRHLGIGLSIAQRFAAERGGTATFQTLPEGNVVEFVLPYM